MKLKLIKLNNQWQLIAVNQKESVGEAIVTGILCLTTGFVLWLLAIALAPSI